LLDPLSQNPYSYTLGDPINFSDPSGHGILSSIGNALASAAKTVVNTAKTVVNTVVNTAKNVYNTVYNAVVYVDINSPGCK